MDKDLFQKKISRNEKNHEFEPLINKTINNNIFDDKSDFSYFTPSKIKMTKSLTKIGLVSPYKKNNSD